jgi:4-hydroxy-2-oxoheptanedioate aldolase
MRPNRLRELWAAGKPVVAGWCSIPNAFTAELMAGMGWDAITIDTQHGLIGYADMLAMLQAISTTEVVPLVRVSWNQPGEIMRALDAGASGVICPMVNTAAECAQFVRACRYPPDGYRSFGPTRAGAVNGPAYYPEANRELLALAMIETADGMTNLDAIVATPGLDGIYIGPSDLSLAHGGQPLQDSDDAALLAQFDRIVAACRAAGIRSCVHTTSPAYAQQMIARGFDMVTIMGDVRYLTAGRRDVVQMRDWLQVR